MPIAVANGLAFDYELSGADGAPTIVLIMGLGMPAAAWPPLLVDGLVARGFRVLRFDNRDCGHSTRLHGGRPAVTRAVLRALLRLPVQAPYLLRDMAADTVGLLDALAIARAHVVGASMGGMIAQTVAAHWPQRVTSLTSIMSATGNRSLSVALGDRRALRALLQRPRDTTDVEALTQHLMRVFGIIGSPGYPADPVLLRESMERVARRGYSTAGTARQLLAILASGDRRAELRAIRAPTLVIHGAADPLVPLAAGRDTAQHIGGARLQVFAGMGHDFPAALQPAIVEQIAEHCLRAQGDAPLATSAAA